MVPHRLGVDERVPATAPVPAAGWWTWAPAVAGVAALLARPWFLPAGVAVGWRVVFFVTLGAVGMGWRARDGVRAGLALSSAVLAIGAAAFAIGRFAVDAPVRPGGLALAVALNALAAVTEEAFFRRYLFDLLLPSVGAGGAVVVTAGLFALAHVTVWGWWVLPLDLAAGLVLSWQRAATGRWSVPAVTHVLANTLALL